MLNEHGTEDGCVGKMWVTFYDIDQAPAEVCIVAYDNHDECTGDHGAISAGSGRNGDNSVEKGWKEGGTVSCEQITINGCRSGKFDVCGICDGSGIPSGSTYVLLFIEFSPLSGLRFVAVG
jgi:hypothetical protein